MKIIQKQKIDSTLSVKQNVFAATTFGVESWEYGKGKPSGAAARMLTIVDLDPEAIKRYGFAEW